MTLTFQADGGRRERLSYVLCQHHTSQFATGVKETVWKLEQHIRSTECDLFVCKKEKKKVAIESLAGQKSTIGKLFTGEGEGSNVEIVLHLL